MADADPTYSPHSAPRMDVFGNVEPVLTSKPQLVVHTREQQKVDDSPPTTPYTPIRSPSSRAGSRRTQSVDVAAKHLAAPSPLGPARRKRGEREREKIRAELDAAPALTLDPRIAHDVLDLERRFAAASKGKSPVSRPPHRSHRHRHSLGSSTLRPNVPARPGSTEPPALSALPESGIPESDTSNFSGGDNQPPELVGPALPSSGVPMSPVVPSAPTQPLAPPQGDSPPKALKVDKPAYAGLLPTSDPEAASGSGAEVKRTSKAAKRTSLTAMLGLGSRKKPKEAGHQKDSAQEDDKHFSLPSLRPSPKRVETHNTTRTINTILTTHTSATAGSVENGDKASLSGLGSGHGQGLSPVSGARSASATSSNLRLVEEPPAVIEPSAKTLARAAATRDQLQKRYDMLYRSLGDASSAMGSEELSTRSVSGSGSILKRESPGPASGSIDSHPRPSSKEHPPLKARGLNPLEVVRWRSGILQRARRSAEAGRAEIQERHGEAWEREAERRVRDAPPGDHMGPYAGSGVPAYQNVFPAALGDSLPEANSLSWLPYLEPVFAEERARAEGSGEFGLGVGRGLGSDVPKGMSGWYILASFVEGFVAAKEQEEREALAMEAELGVVRGPDGSFVSDGLRSFVSDGPKSMASEMQGRGTFSDIPLKDPHTRSITSDVRAKAIVNAAYAHARGTGTGTGTISDDAASGTGSRFAILDRALRTKSRRSSIIAESIGGRSRQGSLGLGTTSEPPSPSHFTAFSPPILSSASPATSQTSHPGAKALGVPGTATWLAPAGQGETRPARSQSGSRLHSRTHSRSQSQARSISAGNTGNKSHTIGDFNLSAVSFRPSVQPGVGEGKSMSPAASRMNLANILMGSAARLGGLAARRRGTGVGRPLAKDGVSGSENENESGQVSSDMSPSDSARIRRRRRQGTGGMSDGEGGRVKRPKTTWREKGAVPLSDGGAEIDEAMKRRSLRLEEPELSVEMRAERSSQEEEEGKEREHAKKQVIMEEAQEALEYVNTRLHSFTQLLDDLNAVHQEGSDVFGEMFMAVPQEVVSILTPELSEDEGMDHTSTSAPPLTPTHPHSLAPLSAFAKKLDDIESNPTLVDHVGRMTLDASLPIRAFDALHELDHRLGAIAKQIGDLRQFCDETEKERWAVKQLYEDIAGNVGTTYPECTDIEQLLSSLVTEDMPWLPSWLPLWVRHLLEIFSNQIQFLVENGLRIYGYVYSVVSLFVFLFTLIFSVIFMFARFVRSYWWGFLAAGLGGIAYLMMRPPEGMGVDVDI